MERNNLLPIERKKIEKKLSSLFINFLNIYRSLAGELSCFFSFPFSVFWCPKYNFGIELMRVFTFFYIRTKTYTYIKQNGWKKRKIRRKNKQNWITNNKLPQVKCVLFVCVWNVWRRMKQWGKKLIFLFISISANMNICK